MKEVEFYSGDINNAKEIAAKLFADMEQQNPASIYYNRILERPEINWRNIILQAAVPGILMGLIISLSKKSSKQFMMIASIIFLGTYIFLNLKKMIICFSHIYQRFAPASIRMKCRFEPSCSQYMILAVEKYGLLKGMKMGLNRLGRCKVGNGGFDFP